MRRTLAAPAPQWFSSPAPSPTDLQVPFARPSPVNGLQTQLDLPTARKDAGVVTLRKPHFVRGVLRGPDGTPRAGSKVILWGYNDDRHRLDPSDKLAKSANDERGLAGWGLLRMYVAGHEVRTDAKGRFVFGDVATGTFQVIAYDERNGRIGTTERFAVTADPKPIERTTDK